MYSDNKVLKMYNFEEKSNLVRYGVVRTGVAGWKKGKEEAQRNLGLLRGEEESGERETQCTGRLCNYHFGGRVKSTASAPYTWQALFLFIMILVKSESLILESKLALKYKRFLFLKE